MSDTLSVCELPNVSVDCYALYQVQICRSTDNLQSSDDTSVSQNYFYVYVGLDINRGKKFISVDINVDNDFRNDSVYTIMLADSSKYDIQENPMDFDTRLRFSYNKGIQTKEHSVPIVIIPFYNDKEKNRI